MNFKDQKFGIYLIAGDVTSKVECVKEIDRFFTAAELFELNKDDLVEINSEIFLNSILLVDANLTSETREQVLKFYSNKIPIIWISKSSDSDQSIDLLNSGNINNICFVDQPITIVSSIIRELKGSLVRSQLQVLREQSTLISEAALNTKTAVLTTDAQGLVVWVNEAHSIITGYSLEEMVGKKPGELLQGPETSRDTIALISSKLKEEVPFTVEILNYHKNGEKIWLKLDITPVFKNGKLDRYIAFQEDITEKKANEQRLADSLERLQDAQRIGKMCNWVMDANSYDVSWSGLASEILDIEDIDKFDYWEFRGKLAPVSRHHLQTALNELRTSNREYDLTLEFTGSNDKTKILRAIGVPVFNQNKLEKIVGVIQDITEQHEAERLANKSLQHLNTIADNMQGGVARIVDKIDGSREIVFANKGFYDLYEVDEHSAKNNFDLIFNQTHKDDKVLKIYDILTEVQRTGHSVDQYFRIINPSGKLKWVHLISNATASTNGDIIHDFIVTDITERIQRDRLLEEISEVSINGGWELNLITGKLNWTSVTKQIHEVPEDFEPDPETAINFYKEGESRDLITQHFDQLISEGTSHDGRFELITAKGNHKWVRAKGAAEYAGDQIVRVYGFFQDITETVQREQAIIDSLNEKNALLGEIHHRVKNNLAIISGLLQLELMKGDESKFSLEDAVNRIQSIATVHEILYNTENFNVIFLDTYLDKLTLNISKTHPSFISDINLISDIEHVGISINQAVPVGLLLNELITNSLKHAFSNNEGSIYISIKNLDEATVNLKYSDSGLGFDTKALETGTSLGYKLINSLLLQLEADYSIETESGFKLECNFTVEEIEKIAIVDA